MANGHVHEHDSITIALVSLPLLAIGLKDIQSAMLFSFGSLCGIFLTPDLDVNSWILSKRKLVNRLKGIGYLWFAYWYLYGIVIPHRHWVSHFPVVGSFVRVVYLSTPMIVYVLIAQPPLKVQHLQSGLIWFAGLVVSDIAHWARDIQ